VQGPLVPVRRGVLLALLASAVLASPAAAAERQPVLGGLHNARYCEVLELRGALPRATVTVWNTIGLNDCPAAWWDAFDAGALAQERNASLVILNGPRHFLMDSVSAPRGATIETIHGERLRRVATIPIRTAADLAQTPYTDRVIERSNVWRWKRGRRVFELVAPGGDVYVMQAYAQIKDPDLTLAQLPRLGRRLDLPEGWRYRSRRLRRELALRADGGATIVQDELQNTYQLASTTRPAGRRAKRRALRIEGRTKAVGSPAPGAVIDRGTVTGTPFGKGTIVLNGTLAGGRLEGTFRLTFTDGSVLGTTSMPFTIAGNGIDFAGTSRITGGTGACRGIRSGALQTSDHNTLDGQNGTLSVSGSVRY
jgi:hypothetical protein